MSSDWFGCVLVISCYVAKVFSELLAISTSYEVNDIGRGARKVITYLNGSLGSRNFLYVMNERQVLHRERAHLKVTGWSLV